MENSNTNKRKKMLAESVFAKGKRPFFPIGVQGHNMAGYSLEELENLFEVCRRIRVNSCAIPIGWERFEPQEGQYDTELVRDIILACRERNLRLCILWFGTWKNGHMKYVPQWVKEDRERFRRVRTHDGCEIGNLSSFCLETQKADKKAFCRLMEVIRDVDAREQTVYAVQVQNELGIIGRAVRDYGEEANRRYREPVPRELVEHLKNDVRGEEITAVWKECGAREEGDWEALFGRYGDEALQAASMASYVNDIVVAGKAIYPLPMYTNAWLDRHDFDIPGIHFPSGGAVMRNLAIWRWCAPALDMVCPDIYNPVPSLYNSIAETYARPDNPLYVPETGWGDPAAMGCMRAIADHGLTGIHAFGAESLLTPDGGLKEDMLPMVDTFKALSAVWPLLLRYRGQGNIRAVYQEEFAEEQSLSLEGVRAVAYFGSFPRGGDYRYNWPSEQHRRGRGLVIQLSEREFILCGAGFRMAFRKNPPMTVRQIPQEDFQQENFVDYVTVEEGYVEENGIWHCTRIRNGDDTDFGVYVFPDHGAVRVVLD